MQIILGLDFLSLSLSLALALSLFLAPRSNPFFEPRASSPVQQSSTGSSPLDVSSSQKRRASQPPGPGAGPGPVSVVLGPTAPKPRTSPSRVRAQPDGLVAVLPSSSLKVGSSVEGPFIIL